ncbi:putative fatty acyl-CoA reductase CG8306 [Haematobia irritans]|uniref:putative fatty acyl-CoA reductase CG8306 n=1 Tax=Haematobia irritans TaxID=7368 RepID=UPI003F4F6F5E
MSDLSPVQNFYRDKTIFITGVTGFMGKVLLEKLLYSLSDLKEIIVICRAKKGKSPETRLEDIWKFPIFQRIKDEKPEVMKKVTVFDGDINREFLGLSEDNLNYVTNRTNIVFHMAASLKMECPLTESIDMNLAGTRRALDVGRKMKHLERFVHLSTAFCNYDHEIVHEEVYDCPQKPEDLMHLAEWMDPKSLDLLRDHLIEPHPNNYTYTKRLAELHVRNQYDTMPVVIARPSIVTSSYKEPLPGWMDNLNGPVGIVVAAGKGVLRSLMCNPDVKIEVIPVDIAVTGLIVIPYHLSSLKERPVEVPVINLTLPECHKQSSRWVMEMAYKCRQQYPLSMPLWYPNITLTMNKYYHWFNVILFMWLPALIIDMLLLLFGQRRFMMHVHKRVMAGLKVLQFFTTQKWNFKCDQFMKLCLDLDPKDKEIFPTPLEISNHEEYIFNSIMGGRQYVCKEPLSNLPKARATAKVMFILDRVCKTILCSLFFYWLAHALGVVDFIREIDPLHLLVTVK